jgi:predicted transcriptional regulator
MSIQIKDTTFYSVSEVAQIFNVTTASVRNYIRQGHLKGQKVMGRWIVLAEGLDKFLKEAY